ncbi:unnamed protein product [Ceutorhynchus assimilis]|uniref:PH domain-containing protein n=1 Tax=Ceutorhynchus assimilis TaxID=467358 RepID=A0A9P0GNK6_9CUCU|nr:unnamed protein product [Ceutorhynchus assimilis]
MDEYYQIMPKMSGYLEKKGKKKMMSCYKKYWFVLEGRLLLYYKSKDEYDAISPCKGTINLGPTCNIKTCASNTGVFQIESKTTTITLKADNKEDQHRWMEALMSALNQSKGFKKLDHFRYSVGELSSIVNSDPNDENNATFIERLQKMGAKNYGNSKPKANPLESQKQISLSDESIPTNNGFKNSKETRFRKCESVIIENEEYGKLGELKSNSVNNSVDDSSEGIYERIPSSDSVFTKREILERDRRSSQTTENEVYWTKCSDQLEGNTDYYEAIDYNDNIQMQLRKKSKTSNEEENVYAEAEAIVKENRDSRSSVVYASIEGQVDYVEIGGDDAKRNSSISSQESNSAEKDKKKFGFGRKHKKSEDKKVKVKKSESFLQRVWNKKSKNKKSQKEISLSTSNIAKKLEMTDDDALKTLSELHPILQKQFSNMSFRSQEKMHMRSRSEDGDAEIRSEIIIREVKMRMDNKDNTPEDQTCPSLPPRNPKPEPQALYQEMPKHLPPLVPPKMKKKLEIASLDDLLESLSQQAKELEQERKNQMEDSQNKEGKVKELIKRFSIGKEEGVEMRQKTQEWKPKTSAAYSNDLDKLLDELSKVTIAPIMTPGVTTSLINPEISDKEILKMVPIRRRKLSEPDYDVPRPHRSLVNLPKKDENALEATRFFGPILKPSDYPDNRPPTPPADYSNLPSITPDSLEIEVRKNQDELQNVSFQSHDYLGGSKPKHNNRDFLENSNLYDDPRLMMKPHFYLLDDNRFIDSLEP